jgi:hypothetical protein
MRNQMQYAFTREKGYTCHGVVTYELAAAELGPAGGPRGGTRNRARVLSWGANCSRKQRRLMG